MRLGSRSRGQPASPEGFAVPGKPEGGGQKTEVGDRKSEIRRQRKQRIKDKGERRKTEIRLTGEKLERQEAGRLGSVFEI